MQFGCPQLCALTNLGSKSIGDLYNVIGNGARPYFEDLFNQYPVLVDPFSSRENDKWFTLRIGYGAAASGLCKGLLLKDTAREAGVTLLDEFGCITPMAAKMLSAPVGRRSWINPDFAQVFQSIAQESNWDMVYRIAKLISDGYSKSTFNVSSILRQGTSMGKECVEAAEESDEGMISWVNGSGQTYYGFAPEPDYEKGDDGKYITPSIRLRQKVNGVSVQVTMRPLYNAYSASMLGPDRMHDCFDSVVVNNGNCIFAGMFLNNATIHDALGMGVNDTIIGKAVWQGVYVVCNDELPASFEALIEKYGVQDVRTGSHPWPGEQIRLSEGFIQ